MHGQKKHQITNEVECYKLCFLKDSRYKVLAAIKMVTEVKITSQPRQNISQFNNLTFLRRLLVDQLYN